MNVVMWLAFVPSILFVLMLASLISLAHMALRRDMRRDEEDDQW
jgi:hypothetical protein